MYELIGSGRFQVQMIKSIDYTNKEDRPIVYMKERIIIATTTAPTTPQNPNPSFSSYVGGGVLLWYVVFIGCPHFGQDFA